MLRFQGIRGIEIASFDIISLLIDKDNSIKLRWLLVSAKIRNIIVLVVLIRCG